LRRQKGVGDDLDDSCHFPDLVAVGLDQWLYVGRIHSCSVGHRPRCGGGPTASGTQSRLAIWILAREDEHPESWWSIDAGRV